MPLQIVPYGPEHVSAVAAFNERARAHQAPFELSKTPVAGWLPRLETRRLFREFFLAIESREVRGGFTLRRQDFLLNGATTAIANYQGPLSEGIWDRRQMMAGVQMLRAAMKEQPLLYALGMGGMEQPLPKLLASAAWQLLPVPFQFKVFNATAFLRNLQPLRRSRSRALLLDAAAACGLGALAIHGLQGLRTRTRVAPECAGETVSEFGPWADEVWAAAKTNYLFSAVRDQANQNILFGDGNAKNIILRCRRGEREIGWAVMRCTPMRDDKYFGHLRLGSLVDCLAIPGEEETVVLLATRHLRTLKSDLVVTNQTHQTWLRALQRNGYGTGPSNFILACSPKLVEALVSLETARPHLHFNRADGDGPIHL